MITSLLHPQFLLGILSKTKFPKRNSAKSEIEALQKKQKQLLFMHNLRLKVLRSQLPSARSLGFQKKKRSPLGSLPGLAIMILTHQS
jgi:hypothetical protein